MKTKSILPALAVLVALLLGGCESVGGSLAARFSPVPVVRTFEAPPERAFVAAKAALETMGYTIRSARPKSGVIEATGRVAIDDSFRSSDQYSCRVEVTSTPDGAAVVRLEVREASEERTNAGAMRQTERVIPNGGTHERFFEELQRRL
ncbi:MAG: hypothetical protein IPL39_23020 [Opitutaceae bacterium]|nr:hypothetical protein [Opitutaceae bacterium]